MLCALSCFCGAWLTEAEGHLAGPWPWAGALHTDLAKLRLLAHFPGDDIEDEEDEETPWAALSPSPHSWRAGKLGTLQEINHVFPHSHSPFSD